MEVAKTAVMTIANDQKKVASQEHRLEFAMCLDVHVHEDVNFKL